MKILGIDPGTRILGYAVLESDGREVKVITYGSVQTNAKEALAKRLECIYLHLIAIIEKYKPDVVALEKAFYGKNIQSAFRIGESRGVSLLAAATHNLVVHEYSPTKVKKSVVGVGNAHKSQIQYMLQNILSLSEIPNFDAADAIAIAMCHFQQFRQN